MRVKSSLPGRWHFGTTPTRVRKCAVVANSVPDCRIGAFPTTMPTNDFFAGTRKIPAPGEPAFSNSPRTWPKTRRCHKLCTQPSNLGIPNLSAKKFFFACTQKISAPESRHLGTVQERDRKRAGVAKLVPDHWIGGIPHHNAKKFLFRMRAKNSQPGSRHIRTAPECDRKCVGVANSVPDHRIRAFPTTMPRNNFLACARKIHSRGVSILEPPQNATENVPVSQIRSRPSN